MHPCDPATLPFASLTLVLGGQRSGKSVLAERMAIRDGEAFYLATAEARDGEMEDRIKKHQERRGNGWHAIEEPLDIAATLPILSGKLPVLIDCLTVWLANLMEAGQNPARETARLIDAARAYPGPVIAVSNEVGLGVIPANKLARQFADEAGLMNQRFAADADRVIFAAAGLPIVLKNETSE